MKKKLIGLALCLIVLSSIFILEGGKIAINNERVGVMFLEGGYRAYWIRYSEGLTWDNEGKPINLWCFPRFEKCDIRKLFKGVK